MENKGMKKERTNEQTNKERNEEPMNHNNTSPVMLYTVK